MSEYDPIQEITDDNEDDLFQDDREQFKGEQDHTYRLSLALWPTTTKSDGTVVFDMDAKRPRMLRTKALYAEGVGYILYKGAEYARLTGEEVKDRIATVVIVWPVHEKGPNAGKTDKVLFQDGRFKVMPMVFNKTRYQGIMGEHNTSHLGEHDLKLKCTNAQYQNMNVGHYGENYLRKIMEGKPEMFQEIAMQVEAVSKRLRKMLGRDMTLAELREKLGGGSGGDDDDVVEEEVASSEVEFDNLLGGIIE